MDIFTVIFYQPIFNLLIVLYRLFSENLGIAIILVALLSKLITYPITVRQIKMASSSKEMQDKIKEVKQRYKNDKEKQNQELMKIQSQYLPTQLAGCLPAILQLILFINIYNVINNIISKGIESFNTVAYPFVEKFVEGAVMNTSFFGIVDLKTAASSIGFENLGILPYIVIILLVAVTQYYSMKLMTPKSKKEENIIEGELVNEGKKKKDKNEKLKGGEDFSEVLAQSTQQTMLLFPFMIAILSYSLPIGLGIYWIAQSIFAIIQTLIVKKRSNLNTEIKSVK